MEIIHNNYEGLCLGKNIAYFKAVRDLRNSPTPQLGNTFFGFTIVMRLFFTIQFFAALSQQIRMTASNEYAI